VPGKLLVIIFFSLFYLPVSTFAQDKPEPSKLRVTDYSFVRNIQDTKKDFNFTVYENSYIFHVEKNNEKVRNLILQAKEEKIPVLVKHDQGRVIEVTIYKKMLR